MVWWPAGKLLSSLLKLENPTDRPFADQWDRLMWLNFPTPAVEAVSRFQTAFGHGLLHGGVIGPHYFH